VSASKKTILLVIAGVLAWVIVSETFFRLFYPQPKYIQFKIKNGIYIAQPDYFDWVTPSLQMPFCRDCPRTQLRLDSEGQRIDESGVTESRVAKQKTVLFMGASFTAGLFSLHRNSFPQQFEALSKNHSAKTCTLYGISTRDFYAFYKNFCRNYSADTVVLQLTAGHLFEPPDFIFRDSFGYSPLSVILSRIPESHYTVKLTDELEYVDLSKLPASEFASLEERLSQRPWLYNYSHLFRLIYHDWKIILGGNGQSPADKKIYEGTEITAANKTLEWIMAIKKLVQADHRKFAVFVVPKADLAKVIVSQKKLPERWNYLLSNLKKKNVDIISGSDFLMENPNWKHYFYTNDGHPTDKGYNELAKVLVRHFEGN
jgi:hypothetical protein